MRDDIKIALIDEFACKSPTKHEITDTIPSNNTCDDCPATNHTDDTDECDMNKDIAEDDDNEEEYDDDDEDDFEFDDEIIYEVKCPTCGEVINLDEEMLEAGGIECPACGEDLEFDAADVEEE